MRGDSDRPRHLCHSETAHTPGCSDIRVIGKGLHAPKSLFQGCQRLARGVHTLRVSTRDTKGTNETMAAIIILPAVLTLVAVATPARYLPDYKRAAWGRYAR
jgi:hypothetical protein